MKNNTMIAKRIMALALSIVMVISILPTIALSAFAADEITLDFIPTANETAKDTTAIGTTATIKGTKVKIYEDLYYGAPGMEVAVTPGTEIDLITEYTFSNGVVVYRFDYWGHESPALYDAVLDYCFIPATEIEGGTVVEPEVTPDPQPTPEPTPEVPQVSVVNYGSLDFDAEITADALTVYENHLDAEFTTVNGVKGEKVHVYFFYQLSDGTTRYKVEYAGTNPQLATVEFVNAADVAEVVVEEPTPEEPEEGGIVDFGSISKTMYIASNSLTLYKNHIDDVEATTVSGVKNEKVKVYFYYELSDGTVKYKVEYTGRNRSLKSAISGGYEFIKSDSLSATKGKTASSRGWNF